MMFTLGTDAELFAVDKSGEHHALCGLIGGTKENPMQIKGLAKGFALQEDNVAVEFNIPPADCSSEFVSSVAVALAYTNKLLQKEHGFELSRECAVSFSKKELSHPNALIFGCEPDYDAWKMEENRKPHSKDKLLRTAGGHIHVGYSMDMIKGVQNMDLCLGVPSILLDDSKGSVTRRELYGKAGAMRPKPYGWEYRTLSNFWVFDPKLVKWVFDATMAAVQFQHKFTDKEGAIITNCINTGDKKAAEGLIKHYSLVMP
jgi:hypothetical protein